MFNGRFNSSELKSRIRDWKLMEFVSFINEIKSKLFIMGVSLFYASF